ncbi:unnamed protein product, partial [Effrenium voratum]
ALLQCPWHPISERCGRHGTAAVALEAHNLVCLWPGSCHASLGAETRPTPGGRRAAGGRSL